MPAARSPQPGGSATLERWLRLLPEEMIQRNPGLLMIKAWALQFMWQLDLQAKVLQQVEELLNSEPGASLPVEELHILRGQNFLTKSSAAYFNNQARWRSIFAGKSWRSFLHRGPLCARR